MTIFISCLFLTIKADVAHFIRLYIGVTLLTSGKIDGSRRKILWPILAFNLLKVAVCDHNLIELKHHCVASLITRLVAKSSLLANGAESIWQCGPAGDSDPMTSRLTGVRALFGCSGRHLTRMNQVLNPFLLHSKCCRQCYHSRGEQIDIALFLQSKLPKCQFQLQNSYPGKTAGNGRSDTLIHEIGCMK